MALAVCAFCRRRKTTEEHLIGRWIGELFPGSYPGAFASLGSKDTQEKTYPAQLFNQTVYAACAKCNNRWMSAMEGFVKPFLGPMIRDGTPTTLSSRQQRDLASWALKTALVFDCLHTDNRQIPESFYSEFYTTKLPTSNYLIWLGYRGVIDKDDSGNQFISRIDVKTIGRILARKSESDKIRDELKQGTMFVGTIGIGRVALQVMGHNYRHRITTTRPEIGVLLPIWPGNRKVDWPPQIGIERVGGLKGLHGSIEA